MSKKYNAVQRWFVRREERKSTPKPLKPHEHAYWWVVAAGGWEVWQCDPCSRTTIPSMFGFMWPNLRILQWVNPTLRCKRER